MLINSPKSFVRIRCFILIVGLSKFDDELIIGQNVDSILAVLNDDKPTNVRMTIKYLPQLIENKNALVNKIIDKIKLIDYSKYNESMKNLLKKDFLGIIL